MTVGFELVAGGATSGSLSSFWLEEASGPPSSPLQKRGRLYAVAEGATHETEGTIRAIRDGYFGDIPRSSATNPTDLHLAIEAANSLLYSRGGIGVSCVCAIVYGDNELAVHYLGDARAYLLSTTNGIMERLTEGTHTTKTLGTRPKVEVGEMRRSLQQGDVLILCSGSVTEAIGEPELGDIASAALSGDVKRLAQRIISRATAKDPDAEATAIVVACRPTAAQQQMELELEPEPLPGALPDQQRFPPQKVPSGQPLPTEPKLVNIRRLLMGVGRSIRTLLFVSLLLVMAIAIFLGYRLFQTSNAQEQGRKGVLAGAQSQPFPTTSPIAFGSLPTLSPADSSPVPAGTPFQAVPVPPDSTTTATPTSAEAMKRIEALWPLGDKGSVAALEEIVGLLEEQRKLRPDDKTIAEKLAVARANLTYRQGMKQVEAEWPTATAASTIQGWSKAVEVLEGLYVQPPLAGYRERIVEKLYAAHVNYGKALEAAGRNYEAWGQYQRALQIDPTRPEASAALRRF